MTLLLCRVTYSVPHCFEIRAVDTWQITADRPHHEEKVLSSKYYISYCCALKKSVSCPFQQSERHAGQNFKLWQSDLITSVLFSLHKPLIQQHVIKSSFAWKAPWSQSLLFNSPLPIYSIKMQAPPTFCWWLRWNILFMLYLERLSMF